MSSEQRVDRESGGGGAEPSALRADAMSEALDRADAAFREWYSPLGDFLDKEGGDYDSRDLKRRFTLAELHQLTYRTLGLPYRACVLLANDAVRNRMSYRLADDPEEEHPSAGQLRRFNRRTDLWNQADKWLEYNNVYGLGFLVAYWGSGPQDFSSAPPSRPPTRFQAFSPRYVQPLNAYETDLVGHDRRRWRFVGGVFGNAELHPDRVHVLCTRELEGQWRGLSLLDPVKLPLIIYLNALINLGRGIRKWSEVVPALKFKKFDREQYDKYLEIGRKYQANRLFMLGEGDEVQFHKTGLGEGINEPVEILREGLASAWGIPLNQLLGRSVTGGIGGEGAVISKEDYAQTLGNLQKDCTYAWRRLYESAGFDLDGCLLEWNLAVQKTRTRELEEQRLELENEKLRAEIARLRSGAPLGDSPGGGQP